MDHLEGRIDWQDPDSHSMSDLFGIHFKQIVETGIVSKAWAMLSGWQWPDRIDRQEGVWNLHALIFASEQIAKKAISHQDYLTLFWEYLKQSAYPENFQLLEEFAVIFKQRFNLDFPFSAKEARFAREIHSTSWFIAEDLAEAYELQEWIFLSNEQKLAIRSWAKRALDYLFASFDNWIDDFKVDLDSVISETTSNFADIIPDDLSDLHILEVRVYGQILDCWGITVH